MTLENSLKSQKSYKKELLLLTFVLFPIIYIGIIIAVVAHEIFGHGVSTGLLGGSFDGFGILLDGMGYAMINTLNLSLPSVTLVLLGGLIVTTILAVIFFIISNHFKHNYLLSTIFLILAFTAFMDSIPYFFFDAIYLGGIGDYSIIYSIYPNEFLRYILIIVLGLIMTGGIFMFNLMFIRYSTLFFSRNIALSSKQQLQLYVYIFVLQFLGWVSFDWNQLIPGVGFLPVIIGMVITSVILIALYLKPSQVSNSNYTHKDIGSWKHYIGVSWGICMTLMVIIVFYLQHGVIF